jgi:cation transport regulator ChaC
MGLSGSSSPASWLRRANCYTRSHIQVRTRIALQPGQVGLFGYGSLLLLSSMERTLGRRYESERYACHVRGWRRSWDSIYPNKRYYFLREDGDRCYPRNILYLNVRRGDGLLSGVAYVISEDDLRGYDEREAVYDRVDITEALTDLEVTGGPVWMYVGKPEYVLTNAAPRDEAAIRRTYVEIVEAGLDEFGPEFRRDYERSSDPVPRDSVMDDILE